MKVIVRAPNEGQEVIDKVIAVNPNKEGFGSIMVDSYKFINAPGSNFINKQRRVAFISGSIEDLQTMVKELNLTPNCDYSKKTGTNYCLIVKEQIKPFFEGQSPKINPSTDEELSTPDGEAIYRQTFITQEGTDEDVLLRHAVEENAVEVESKPVEYQEKN